MEVENKKLYSEPMPALGSRHVPTKSNKNEVLQRENAFKVKVFKAILAASSFAIYRPKDSALSDRYPREFNRYFRCMSYGNCQFFVTATLETT
jgi:hypothetical protein